MARSHVVKLETNLKAGAVMQPGPKTLIVGRNRSGKSTRLNGIEAAGSGRVSDVAGRALLSLDADLIMLAPGNGGRVFASAKLSDGQVCTWDLERGHRAKRSGPEIAFPLRDVREAILGGPDKARKWILTHAGDVRQKDVFDLVPGGLHKRLRGIMGLGAEGFDRAPVDLTIAIDAAKKRVRDLNAAVKAARGGGAPPRPPPTDAEIAAAESVVASMNPAASDARRRLAAVQEGMTRLHETIVDRERRLSEIKRALDAAPASAPISEIVRSALLVAEALAQAKANACAICGHAIDPAALATRAANGRRKLDETIKRQEARVKLEDEARSIETVLAPNRAEMASLKAENEQLAEVVKLTPEPTDPDVDLAAARARAEELRSLRAGWTLTQKREEEALQGERDSQEWGQVADALGGALGTLVERARAKFEARVQQFLPAPWRFGIDLLDGDREVLRIGLRQAAGGGEGGPGVLRAALSGVEWATVTAALALATAPHSGPVVIAPEERAFDPETLTEVLAAFSAVGDDAQVIVTSPIMPSALPPGWTLVEVERAPEDAVGAPTGNAGYAPGGAPKRGPGRPRKTWGTTAAQSGDEKVEAAGPEVLASFTFENGKAVEQARSGAVELKPELARAIEIVEVEQQPHETGALAAELDLFS